MMQAQMTKKEKTPVVFCPRCHAQNLATQKQCGKCGYVFPTKGAFKGEKKPAIPGTLPAPNSASPTSAPPMFSGEPPLAAAEDTNDDETQPPKMERPKAIPESGKSEGLASRGAWLTCPRCGADIKPDAKRCGRCGYKP